jgi:hypothetical protein
MSQCMARYNDAQSPKIEIDTDFKVDDQKETADAWFRSVKIDYSYFRCRVRRLQINS